ncbi:hypothetical protein [Aquabacterium sp. OR-4]|uniref:hypothetical protein n=1 Tax=Aquabacterium sp. OR-4 TaxID=2978127 RepID=UPI0028C883B4|nr:hypothetical protein [Aquabacterium sp. OR-4]MDT7838581.1 hypothetical protein [Aquabacterium sp. OR-4]
MAAPAQGHRFSSEERRILLTTPGIGQGVIDRIEQAGVQSVRQLHELGIDAVVDRICDGVGNLAWRNRKRALARALAAIRATDTAVLRHHQQSAHSR